MFPFSKSRKEDFDIEPTTVKKNNESIFIECKMTVKWILALGKIKVPQECNTLYPPTVKSINNHVKCTRTATKLNLILYSVIVGRHNVYI